jgi:hypothetical protein
MYFFVVVCTLAAGPRGASADTIFLKNGRKIVAAHVHQQDGQVSYETASGEFSLPSSIVDKVVRDPASTSSTAGTSQDRAANLPIAPPSALVLPADEDVARQTVHDGVISGHFLRELESEALANPTPEMVSKLVAAESAAAQFKISAGDFKEALTYYDKALRFAPAQFGVLVESSYLHLRCSEYSAALDLLAQARRIDPDSAEVAKLMGWAYYGLNRVSEAVTEWKRSLAAKPDEQVQHALERAERDAQEEVTYREGETAHFQLRYNGDAAPELARAILDILETEFEDISSTLQYVPPEKIGVILYTNQAFADITRAPNWVGALNDGRMRVPVEGLSSVTSELARILKHELTHSFVAQKTGGRCPTWLQEGIAQYMEGQRSARGAGALVAAYQGHMDFSLSSYEGPWLNLPKETAAGAYAWSLATVEAIVNDDGMTDLDRILDHLAAQATPRDALRAVLRESYADLADSTVQYLRKAYL